ncbi:MAG TPA: alanine racemase C-terminal domain-containing protein, partial [Capsulimonadaceae bacterium]|nr:alanine racemase C-terminal domain-containing protein [Capsulimonadaceae bacterium]
SAALLRLPESRLDMVRAGTLLYGQYPSADVPRLSGLQTKTWLMQARVVFVHDLSPGSPVGYGAEITVKRKTRAAVLPIGFADGFAVSPNSLFRGTRGLRAVLKQDQPHVFLQGYKAPVLGRVAMQMIVVDVTDLPQMVRPGDIADVPARRLSASARLPKIYIEDAVGS